MFFLMTFLDPKDVLSKFQLLSRDTHAFAVQPKVWWVLDKTHPLPLSQRMKLTKCLVERRSKGKLYIATDRITQETNTIRKIYLDITNAGQDDGLPTSVLREISHLRSVEHPNVINLRQAEIRENLVQLCFEHHEYNLKEYIRKFVKQGSSRTERSAHSMPLLSMKKIMY